MRTDIHPRYGLCEVTCACGNTFVTRSTKPVIKVEICSACHPFYTGKQKLIDTAGRVEKFHKRFAATGGKMIERKPMKPAKTAALRQAKKILSSTPKKLAKTQKAAKKEDKTEK